jgi:hypothetical protein
MYICRLIFRLHFLSCFSDEMFVHVCPCSTRENLRITSNILERKRNLAHNLEDPKKAELLIVGRIKI